MESQPLCVKETSPGLDGTVQSPAGSPVTPGLTLFPRGLGKVSPGEPVLTSSPALEQAGTAQVPPGACSSSLGILALPMFSVLPSAEATTGWGRGHSWQSHSLDWVMARFWMEGGSLGGERVVMDARHRISLFMYSLKKIFLILA